MSPIKPPRHECSQSFHCCEIASHLRELHSLCTRPALLAKQGKGKNYPLNQRHSNLQKLPHHTPRHHLSQRSFSFKRMFSSPASKLLKQPSITSSIRRSQPILTCRSFHNTASRMTIKCYFDCTWTGPELSCDENGKITNKDMSDKRKLTISTLTILQANGLKCH